VNSEHEIIEALAYDYYLERKGNDGSPLEDWLKAEKEIKKVNAAKLEDIRLLKATVSRSIEVPIQARKINGSSKTIA
jgi:hypothetical protein